MGSCLLKAEGYVNYQTGDRLVLNETKFAPVIEKLVGKVCERCLLRQPCEPVVKHVATYDYVETELPNGRI